MGHATTAQSAGDRQPPAVTAFVIAVAGLAVLALLAPLGDAEHPLKRVGVLLAFGGALEVLHGIRRASTASLRRAVTSGVISLLMGLLVISAVSLAGGALVLLLAITFAMDGLAIAGAARRATGRQRLLAWLAARAISAAAVALVVALRRTRRPGSSRSPPRCACSASPGRWRSRPCTRPPMRPRPSSTTWVSPIVRKPRGLLEQITARGEGADVAPIADGWSPSSSRSLRFTSRARSRTARCSGTPRRRSRSSGDMALAVLFAFARRHADGLLAC